MPDQQQGGTKLWVAAGAFGCLALAGALAWTFGLFDGPAKPGKPAGKVAAVELSPSSPLPALAEGLAQGDGMALAVLSQRTTPSDETPIAAIPQAEASGWREVVAGLRTGFPKFSAYGRVSAIVALGQIFDRYARGPAPADWSGSLEPLHQILANGLGDTDPAVRTAALRQVAAFWSWAPGRDLTLNEVDALAAIKEAMHRDVVHRLEDVAPTVRVAAVECLAILPIDDKAAPAVARLTDTDLNVRLSVLRGFADRRSLLDEETILPLLYDNMPGIAPVAEQVLTHRGISDDLLGLCKFMVNPRVQVRASAIPMILERADIDPTLWLVFLSRDRDETVRAKAVEALAGRTSPEARARLQEMAASDPSDSVRQAAARVAPEPATTAALPPLPGSASLNPRAN